MDFDVGVVLGIVLGFAIATLFWIALHIAARKS